MTTFYVVCFDIANNKRGQKVANELLNFGYRVQYSLFECYLDDSELAELKKRIAKLYKEDEDHIRYYPLCGKDEEKMVVIGKKKTKNYNFILS